ncbi:MAG: tRNA (cytidine(34)-2'-O)-methyltransferase [Simkaniaceae bacterium]|nr:tRNA (cytidine(34)-2'-O)-methyltransferase [Simkaniaceae bacterium]
MEIILYQPQIPANTGNIIRTCRVIGAKLTLIAPLGFDISEKALRRARLDYASEVDMTIASSLDDALAKKNSHSVYFLSSKAKRSFYENNYPENVCLVFGNETSGLPESIMEKYHSQLVKLPMQNDVRCLNLSNAVAIASYEVLRQHNFAFNNSAHVDSTIF